LRTPRNGRASSAWDEGDYRTVQAICYPGFTIGGLVGEFGGMLALAVLAALTPSGTARFWWTAAALLLLLAAHAVYWLMTHPVNKAWVSDVTLSRPGATFFGLSSRRRTGSFAELRDAWELSHAIRAGLALLSFVYLAVAATLP
jgi:hypothetical protein